MCPVNGGDGERLLSNLSPNSKLTPTLVGSRVLIITITHSVCRREKTNLTVCLWSLRQEVVLMLKNNLTLRLSAVSCAKDRLIAPTVANLFIHTHTRR